MQRALRTVSSSVPATSIEEPNRQKKQQVSSGSVFIGLLACCIGLDRSLHNGFWPTGKLWSVDTSHIESLKPQQRSRIPAVLDYNLTISQAWRNADGGRWRPLFVGNSESPFATISVWEGDTVRLNLQNEIGFPMTIHWVGLDYNSENWNDGATGVTTYPILPRANFTSVLNTTGQWGLKWCLEHFTTPSVDGNYGTLWIRPAPERERPYHLISGCPVDQQDMLDAEGSPAHLTLYTLQHREMPTLIAQLQAEAYDPYCFHSVLINGKGRVHCRPEGVTTLAGKSVDTMGCAKQPSGAVGYQDCRPSKAPYEIIETGTRRWIMMNFVNTGFEHPWRVSIDNHEIWIVANDGGFVDPQKVDIVQLTNAERVSVMVKLDQPADDYAIRVHALSDLQSIQGYAILRYPHRRHEKLGVPMLQPAQEKSFMDLGGHPIGDAALEDKATLHPYPAMPPPGPADITLRFTATGAPDPENPNLTNCSLNGKTWQVFRNMQHLLHPDIKLDEDYPIVRNLPMGSVVDIVVENDLPVSLPMYKHNKATFRLGSAFDSKFKWKNVAEGARSSPGLFNLEDPPVGYMHELPAGGWLALRWKITEPAATMFHVFRVRYFVQGMQLAMLEGDDVPWPEIPDYVRTQPHVDFPIPPKKGIFD